MAIGERIREIRKAKGLTQKQLAEKMQISYVNISQLENEERNPKIDTLKKIADALGVPLGELIGVAVADGLYTPEQIWDSDAGQEDRRKGSHYISGEIRENTFTQVLNELGYQIIGDGDPLKIIYPDGFKLLNVRIEDIAEISDKTSEQITLLLLRMRYKDNPDIKFTIE